MSLILPRGRLQVAHEEDPRQVLLNRVGDLSEMDLLYNQVLCAIYEMPKDAKTKGGLFIPEKTRDESLWQGKAMLVVKLGNTAFQDDEHFKFNGQRVDVGDWIVARAADGHMLELNSVPMRIYRDTHIIAKIPNPDYVW